MRRRICGVLALFLCVNLALFVSPGSTAQAQPARQAYLHAFYPAYATYETGMEPYIDSLDSISVAWSQLEYTDDVILNSTEGQNGNTRFYYPEDYIYPVWYAKSKGKPLQLSVFSDMDTAAGVLANEADMKKLVDRIVEQTQRNIFERPTPVPSAHPAASPESSPVTESEPSPAISPAPESEPSPAISPTSVPTPSPVPYEVQLDEPCFYDGIVIDFEGFRDTKGDGTPIIFNGKPISQHFNRFLQALRPALKARNKSLFVAVNPSVYYNGYDYKTIAELADRVILMAHDYEPTGRLTKREAVQYYEYDVLSPVKSTAPAKDVKRAVQDVKMKIRDSRLCKKVLLQLAFDSAQWQYALDDVNLWDFLDEITTVSIDKRSTPTYAKIKSRVDNADGLAQNIVHGYNNLLESPYMTYYNPTEKLFNILVYENSKSMASKIRHAYNAGFGGVSIWALGNIPNYTDSAGKRLGLNVWDKILELVNSRTLWTTPYKPTGKVVRFTDKKLEAIIRNVIGKTAGNLYESELLEIDRIRIPENSGAKLAELKYLRNLEFLDASRNSLADLRPLSSLTNLKALYLSRNQVKDLRPLAKLVNLEVLSLNGNSISDITPVAGLVKLKKLYLSENRITSVKPLSKLANLRVLYLRKNAVTDLKQLDGLKCRIEQ